jgi:transposase
VLLIAAGDHPGRLRSEAAWAHLCACAPTPASSGKVTRYRLNRGGDRQASHALWRIVITRMGSHPPARAYVARRAKDGLSKPEIIRCLKRYVAARVCPHIRAFCRSCWAGLASSYAPSGTSPGRSGPSGSSADEPR